MHNLYYLIWTDCITRAKTQPANQQSWRLMSMLAMTFCMAANLLLIVTLLERNVFHSNFYWLNISDLPRKLNNFLTYLFLYYFPCGIINYFLIFKGQRYKGILKKYPYKGGSLFMGYMLTSLFLPIFLLLIGMLFFR